jgi:hypothetical protein
MTIKPLNLFRNLCLSALNFAPKLSKPFQSFIIEVMELYQTIPNHINFLQMERFGRSCESRFRQNFSKSFDWLEFNTYFAKRHIGHRTAIAIDPCFISKSGKCTPGMGYFWSGCACAYKRGLEILGIALVDADLGDATFLKTVQTFTEKRRGPKPHCTKGMKDPDSLIAIYLRTILANKKRLHSLSSTIVADAYFSKRSFCDGITKMGFHLISRLRDDAVLKYLTTVPRTGKRGRPQLFDGRVDIDNLNNNVFSTEEIKNEGSIIAFHSAIAYAYGLRCKVKVVIADFGDEDKNKQYKKIFFSTDTSMSAIDIFDIYRTRFQIEFLFRDAKQNTGLTNCQSRKKEKLDFSFNASLSSINLSKALANELGMKYSASSMKMLLHNAAIIERFILMFGKLPNSHLNNTIFKELLFYGVRNAG